MEMQHDEEQWNYDALADMVQTSDEAIVLADPDGVVVLANKAAGEIVGISHDIMPGHTVEDFGRESMHAFQKIAVSAVVDNNIEVTVRDAKLLHSDGTSTVVDTIVNFLALMAAIWFTLGGLASSGKLHLSRNVKIGATLLGTGVAIWTEPVFRDFYLGQINLILMAALDFAPLPKVVLSAAKSAIGSL